MNGKQLKNSILQFLFTPKENWAEIELKNIVDKQCPISYGIVQQGDHVEGGIPVVRPVDLHCKYVNRDRLKCTSASISNSYSRTILRGDEILLCVRGTTGIVALATKELNGCNVNRGIVPLFFGKDVDRLFVYYQLLTPRIQETISINTMGSALRQINIKDLRSITLYQPPLAEQHRIVAKIEELMPLVEKYGAAQEALDEWNQALPEKLKKSILQEAIQGKLVPQDPANEPASVLLERIRDEKKRLVKEGKLKKKDLEVKPIEEDEIPFEIPRGWKCVRLKDICQLNDGEKKNEPYICMDAKFLRGKKSGEIVGSGKYVQKGDHIILVDGENSGEVFTAPCDGYMGSTFKQLWISDEMYLPYVLYFIRFYKELLRNSKKGAAIPHLNKEIFYSLAIGIPPLAEQRRIVAKIEELFGVIG